jgi:exonuclease III
VVKNGSLTLGERYKKFLKIKLRADGVHPNPGPDKSRSNLSFTTFNCRGLKELGKFRRLMSKINKLLDQNSIVALQETHKIEDRLLQIYCKHKYVRNCELENKAGVILFFNNDFEINNKLIDDKSRYIIAVIESPLIKLVVGNVYFPNDHKLAINFGAEYYDQLRECQTIYPEHYMVTMGDYNTCIGDQDSMNRVRTKVEIELVNKINSDNETCELFDTYRNQHKEEGGFTWSRGSCFSRLDYIFMSSYLIGNIQKVDVNWSFDKSDHAAVTCYLKVNESAEKGPGITRLNSKLLENVKIREEIRSNIRDLVSHLIPTWDPHIKLEYIKMSIRTAFVNSATISNKSKKEEIRDLEEQLNNLKKYREQCAKVAKEECEKSIKIDDAINEINILLNEARDRHGVDIAFKAGAKWYEEGEKSSRYFMGILKKRTSQKLINNLVEEGVEISSKVGIMECVRNFYKKLYEKSEVKSNELGDNFFKHCPKLNTKHKVDVERDITLDELKETLKGCKDTSPGPDGISYSIYKEFWDIIGIYIVESWNHSLKTGKLPPSHKESVLTLLPKAGKDLREIKNWRPITLTNCDAKIITKALAVRMSKVLEEIIDPTQTAYIPGRNVMDNLRSNLFTKSYCNKYKINALLISLDAKKAFDSVDHDYIRRVLKEYGFGEKFIGFFNTLYNDLDVRIMVNGFFSEKIDIGRGVKQGDALSCSLFILCIDPLIRNINNNSHIQGVIVKSKTNIRKSVEIKASGYADDIAVVCQNDRKSLENIFIEYERLTKLSGLELNADKTEILQLGRNSDRLETYNFRYMNNQFTLKAVSKLKICGIVFSTDPNVEYEENIMDKINKLECQLRKWMCRNLTLEGKILIVKTFGLSQLIYNLQCYQILDEDLILVERLIFRFIWSRKWDNTKKFIDRISRKVMKNEYSKGGLRAPDIECLDKALKLKQFVRANHSSNVVKKIQEITVCNLGYEKVIMQEYDRLSDEDWIIRSGQSTINTLTDWARAECYGTDGNGQSSTIAINLVGSINLGTYLRRKKEPFLECIFKMFQQEGIDTLNELIIEEEYTSETIKLNNIKAIKNKLSEDLQKIAENYNGEINNNQGLSHFYIGSNTFIPVHETSVKTLQLILKLALKKTEIVDYTRKLAIDNFDIDSITETRQNVNNVKLRNVFFRLINKDFFTKDRMLRFKMVDNSSCERCGLDETTKHLLWDCRDTRMMWESYNTILNEGGLSQFRVENYNDVYKFNGTGAVSTVKLKLINEIIQIIRPKNMTVDKIRNIIKSLHSTEKYIAKKNNKDLKHSKRWNGLI